MEDFFWVQNIHSPTSNGKDGTVRGTHAFTWKTSSNCCFMVKSCCVIDCTNRFWKNWGRSFYRLLKGKQNNMSRNNVTKSVFKELFQIRSTFWFIHVSLQHIFLRESDHKDKLRDKMRQIATFCGMAPHREAICHNTVPTDMLKSISPLQIPFVLLSFSHI